MPFRYGICLLVEIHVRRPCNNCRGCVVSYRPISLLSSVPLGQVNKRPRTLGKCLLVEIYVSRPYPN